MTDTVRPIREGVRPQFDVEREMAEWATIKLRDHAEAYGEPTYIAIVIGNDKGLLAQSWSPGSKVPRSQTCGAAAAALLKRAVE